MFPEQRKLVAMWLWLKTSNKKLVGKTITDAKVYYYWVHEEGLIYTLCELYSHFCIIDPIKTSVKARLIVLNQSACDALYTKLIHI